MNITAELLTSLGASPSDAARFVTPVKAATALFSLDTPEAVASLLGNVMVETQKLHTLQENLYYTTPAVLARTFFRVRTLPASLQTQYLRNPQKLANLVYADKYGNGNEASGDGWRYSGKGGIQTTFKDNYLKAEQLTGRPYVAQPELLLQPEDAMLSACAYFRDKGCVDLANAGLTPANLAAITKSINSASLEAVQRASLTLKAYSQLKGN